MGRRFYFLIPLLTILTGLSPGCGLDKKISETLDNEGASANPVAVLDGETSVKVKTNVTISGAKSYDPRDEALTYMWSLAERPFGSSAELAADTAASTTFFADKGGYYTVTLVVTNASGVASEVASMRVSVVGTGSNHPPVAIINATQATDLAVLDGSSSYDIDGNAITYSWTLLNAPGGSNSAISSAQSPVAYLSSDSSANLAVRLVVSDGVDSDEAYATVNFGATARDGGAR